MNKDQIQTDFLIESDHVHEEITSEDVQVSFSLI
jgi:hypothetical protein